MPFPHDGRMKIFRVKHSVMIFDASRKLNEESQFVYKMTFKCKLTNY